MLACGVEVQVGGGRRRDHGGQSTSRPIRPTGSGASEGEQGGVDVWQDVGNGLIKSVIFGFTVTFVALLQGFAAQATPEGVAKATTRTVVMASLAVLGLDFILTAMMFSI